MKNTAFTKEQFDTIYPDGIGEHYWNHARNRIIYKFMTKHEQINREILELGCGRGVVLEFLRTKAVNCFGVELGDADPFPGCRDVVYTGTDAFELPVKIRRSVETVMLLDVIEHFEDPATFIEEIRMKFENCRYLLVTVPARQELWTNYDVYNGHFRRYDLAELKKLCTQEISLTEARYFNHLLYPVFWIFARIIKTRETTINAPSGFGIFIHRFLSFVLRSDYALLPAHLPGTSVIALFSLGR